LYTPAANPELR